MIEWLFNNIAQISIVAVLTGITGTLISVYTLVLNRRKIMASEISSNRIHWINAVRDKMIIFINSYTSHARTKVLDSQAMQIKLYFRENIDSYAEFSKVLDLCAQTPYNREDYKKLIKCCQEVLDNEWTRMKWEAGISARIEKKREAMILDKMKKEKR